jgi:two-component system response regulator GlrR
MVSLAARPRRILLVDDEPNLVKILKAGLARLPDCEITTATGSQQALDLFAQQTFDLMITDYRMPGMDGLQLAQAVRQHYPLARIIMLTAFGKEVLTGQAEDRPVQLVLEKPVDIKQVRSAALTALGMEADRA